MDFFFCIEDNSFSKINEKEDKSFSDSVISLTIKIINFLKIQETRLETQKEFFYRFLVGFLRSRKRSAMEQPIVNLEIILDPKLMTKLKLNKPNSYANSKR